MTLAERVVESLKKKSTDWLATVIIGLVVAVALMVYEPSRDFVVNRWNAISRIEQEQQRQAEAIEQIQQDGAKTRADIQALRSPSDVFEISPYLSKAVHGYCTVPGDCEIELWVRRVPGAEECQIVPDLTEYTITTRSTGVQRRVTRLNNDAAQSIGLDWEPILITLKLPVNIPVEPSIFVVVNYFIDCNEANSGIPVRDESTAIEIELRRQ